MRFSRAVALVLAVTVLGFVLTAIAPSDEKHSVFIKFEESASSSQIDSLTTTLGLNKVRSLPEVSVDLFEIQSQRSVEEVVQLCSRASFVVYAEPTAPARALAIPEAEATASPEPLQVEVADYVPGEVIVKFKADISSEHVNTVLSGAGIEIQRQFEQIGVYRCTINGPKGVLKAVEECNADASVEYAEPNYVYKASIEPDDSRFGSLWGMDKIDAPQAWDVQTGSKSIIVGVIDTGVDTGHEDLKANIWKNPGETGDGKEDNGVDDDNNGYVDDHIGWDFTTNDNNPFDDNDHGSHVSGTIGGEGNNGVGVAGVNWSVSIMALKFLAANGSGTTDDAVEAILYGTQMGAKVLSNSWGGGGRSQALEDAIKFANDNGVLFVAAAGNDFGDNDRSPTYPANYEVENVLSVAASTESDNVAGFSNVGKVTVDLAAPGNNILSTLARNRYGNLSGTSMATPHVSGAAALIWAQYPNLTVREVIIRLLGGVDHRAAFAEKVATGGRLNVNNSLSTDPLIASTTNLDNTLDETGPYVVEADIIDDGSIQSATLTYQVTGDNGSQPVEVAMASQGNHHYRGEIPGQTLGSTIVYFVKASDDAGNTTQDVNFTFSIAEPTGGGCCGKPAIDFELGDPAMRTTVNTAANVSFFLLPFVLFRFVSRRKK